MIIEDFNPFTGQHCETTATGSLLNQIGVELSEPMLFGLGEGLSFIFWQMKFMETPFIGGRVKPDVLTDRLCQNLNLKLEVSETTSLKKAWHNVKTHIDGGKAVGVKLDCYHLDYFTQKFHFGGHYVAMYGYDGEYAYLVDTAQQGGRVKTTLGSFALARNEKGPMTSRNRTYTIRKMGVDFDLKSGIGQAINNNAFKFLNPPIKNLSYKGILKTSTEIKKWFAKGEESRNDFALSAVLMEKGGTGGALFRNLYRDFLKESAGLLQSTEVDECYQAYAGIAKLWNEVSKLFVRIAENQNLEDLNQASEILAELSERERTTMERLYAATAQQ